MLPPLRHKLEKVSSSSGGNGIGNGRSSWIIRRGSVLHNNDIRPSYMQTLVLKKQLRQQYTEIQEGAEVAAAAAAAAAASKTTATEIDDGHPKTEENVDDEHRMDSDRRRMSNNMKLFTTDSALGEELLRQVESFEGVEAASSKQQQQQQEQASITEEEEQYHHQQLIEEIEVMASVDDSSSDNKAVILSELEKAKKASPSELAVSSRERFGTSPREPSKQKDLQTIAKEIIGENDVKELSHKLREIYALVRPYLRDGVSTDRAFMGAQFPLQVRMQNVSYNVELSKEFHHKTDLDASQASIQNSHNMFSFFAYFVVAIWKYLQRVVQCQPQVPTTQHGQLPRKEILKNINLVIEPGLNYLVLGPPGSGKSVLLKAIAGLLPLHRPFTMEGSITYNGKTLQDCARDKFFIENAFGYIDQLDDHAPLLTVKETLDFAYQCKTGGRFVQEKYDKRHGHDKDVVEEGVDIENSCPRQRQQLDGVLTKKALEDDLPIQIILTVLGLTGVKDTFVGNTTTVRGVSGGQRRRVTVGEMIVSRTPILCGDELSTGLDAASTYDMIETQLHFGRIRNYSRVFSLLQPSPEVVSLFDQIIVLSEGHILYAGKIEEVEEYFAGLGFRSPEFVDLADFLQLISTEDRDTLYVGDGRCPTVADLAYHFQYRSQQGADIQILLSSAHDNKLDVHGSVQTKGGMILQMDAVRQKYANGFFRSLNLIFRRFLLLWIRDRKVLAFSVVRNIINGASVGGAFFNATDFSSISGAMFQTGIFVLLGSLQSISGLVAERSIYDKQAHANFYSAWPYVLGKSLSQIPQTLFLDTLVSGATLYYMIGLGGRNDILNFLTYALILFVFATLTNQQVRLLDRRHFERDVDCFRLCLEFLTMSSRFSL